MPNRAIDKFLHDTRKFWYDYTLDDSVIQNVQGGSIGIVMNAVWFEPFSDSAEDKSAAERTLSFYMNW